MGCRQCLPLRFVQLKGKHCLKPHCHNGVVDTFGQCFGDPQRTADFRHAKLCVCQLCDSKDDDARWLSLAKPSLEAAFSSRHKCFTISPQHRRDFSFPLVVWSMVIRLFYTLPFITWSDLKPCFVSETIDETYVINQTIPLLICT